MAGEGWESPVDIRLDLLKKGYEYSFYQVVRLLRLLGNARERTAEQENRGEGNIRFRPDLSLGFPASDIAGIEESPEGAAGFRVTATFLGLYGASSPLPTFYTEDLLGEAAEDRSVSRDFLDIVNHRIYDLLFRCWAKYRPFLQLIEEKNPRDLEKLFSFVGLGEKEMRDDAPDSYSLLRYTGLFSQYPRSALGLSTLIADSLGEIPIEVFPCRRRTVTIPPDQRLFLGASGCTLGGDSFLGEEIDDRMGKFQLRIGPLSIERFQSLLPGSPDHRKLAFLTRFYLVEPMEYDIELTLAEGEVRTACLGAPRWSTLGLDTWTFTGDRMEGVKAVFPPHYNQEARIC